MNKLAKLTLFAVLSTTFSTASFADKSWEFFPGHRDGFIMDPTISVMAGQLQSTSLIGDAAIGAGVEISVNCPLIQPPTNRIRQQISYFNYQDDDSTLHIFQANPDYVFEIMPNLEIGGGPGIGFVRADVAGRIANMVAIQIGGSIHYRINSLFIGAETRYQLTTKADVGLGNENGAKNARAVIKIGYNF